MVSNITKRIILFMTIIVIGIMVYLVHSPKFRKLGNLNEVALSSKKNKSFDNSSKTDFEERIAANNKPLPNSARQKVRIGISLPLSGDGKIAGAAYKEALHMALSEIPNKTNFEYELIIEDNSGGKSTYVNTHSLIDSKNVDALLSVFNDSETVAKVSDKEEIPHIACTYGKHIVENHNYTINHYPTTEKKAKAFLENLVYNNIRIFSIVAQNEPHIIEMVEEVKKQAKQENFPILSEAIVRDDVSDFMVYIREIAEKKPEAVMVMLEPKELDVFAEQLNKENLDIRYTSIDFLQHYYNRGLVEGAVFVMASDGDNKFKEDFRKKTVLQIPLCAPNLYDAVKMLVVAFEEGSKYTKPSSEKVVSNLKRITGFPSATGVDIKVSEDGLVESPMIRMKIDKGILKYN